MTKNEQLKKMVVVDLNGMATKIEDKVEDIFKGINGDNMVQTSCVGKKEVHEIIEEAISHFINQDSTLLTEGKSAIGIAERTIKGIKADLVKGGMTDEGRFIGADVNGKAFETVEELEEFIGQRNVLSLIRVRALELVIYMIENITKLNDGEEYDTSLLKKQKVSDDELEEIKNDDGKELLTAKSFSVKGIEKLKKMAEPIIKGYEEGVLALAKQLNIFDESSEEYEEIKEVYVADAKELLYAVVKSLSMRHESVFNGDHNQTTKSFFFLAMHTKNQISNAMPDEKPDDFGNISSLEEYKEIWNGKELHIASSEKGEKLKLSVLNGAVTESVFDFLIVLFEGLDKNPFVFVESIKALETILYHDESIDTEDIEELAEEMKKEEAKEENKLDKLKKAMAAAGRKIEKERDYGLKSEEKLN